VFRFLQWKALARRKKFEAEMDEEFAFHREARVQDLLRQGFPLQEAERRARIEFGAGPRYSEECREAHRLHLIDELVHDLRYGFRSIKRNPGFAAAAILSLALGIGLNTLVFSVFESLLLRPLPIQDPQQVVFVETQGGSTHSFPNYKEFRDNTSTFSGLVGYRMSPIDLETSGNPQRIWGYLATGNYFDVLGIKPAIGRFFHQQEDLRPGASPYAVLSYNAWQARFASDPAIAGKTVRLNGLTYTVLGVAPRGFHGTELFYWPDVWVPMMMQPQIEAGNPWLDNRFTWDTWILGRLKPGVTSAQASADLNRIANDLARRFPDTDQGLRIKLGPVGLVGSAMRRPVRLFLGGLLLLVALVLLTACVNLAGLLLARSADRQREMAIRSSIGAGIGRIVRQILTESLLISVLGGIAGLALATLLSKFLSQWRAPIDFPAQFEVGPDWRVFLYAGLISIAAGVLFGLGPALQLAKADLNELLKGGTGIPVVKQRFRIAFRDLLITAEVALCFVLVFASLLSIRSLQNALSLPLGFNPEGVTTAAFDLGLAAYNEAQGRAFQARVLERVKQLPGVVSAAYANSLPLSIDQSTTGVHADEELTEKGRKAKTAGFYRISPGFLSTLRIPLLKGRDFERHDNLRSPRVAIVNQAFAKLIMHTGDPVRKNFRQGPGAGPRVQVVGLVQDGKYASLTESPLPVVFFSLDQQYDSTTTLVIRSHRPSSEVVNDVRRLIASMDSRLPVYGTGSLNDMLGFALFPMHAAAIALSAFGLLALVLAVTGINGVVAYAISRRTREIGVRVAVGANAFEVLRFLLTKLIALVFCGLLIGVLLALAAGQALSSIVYVASPKDPVLLFLVLLSLSLGAALSCWRPALRALRINPVSALRYE
jgi:predicted permease